MYQPKRDGGRCCTRCAAKARLCSFNNDVYNYLMLKPMGQDVPAQKRILEINPTNQMFETMNSMLTSRADEHVQEYIDLLCNQLLLLEGSKLKDRATFARFEAKLMTRSVKGKDAA
jgi:HSP90 family molecular chaperone